MKVLHLISGGDTGGAKTHVLSLLEGLNKDITADLACFMEGEFSADAVSAGINVEIFDGGFMSALGGVSQKIAQGQYELVHCHGSRANLSGALIKHKHPGVPFISTVHSDYRLDYLGRPMAKLIYGNLNAFSLRRMDALVCVSDSMKQTLAQRDFDAARMHTIYNGVDFAYEPSAVPRAEWLSSIGCDFADDDIIVGIAARLDPVKDVATLIRGFAEAAQSCPALRLLIAGDGQQAQSLRELAQELGVGEKVFFAGWLKDVDSFYNTIDINTICSLSETFPYAVTEAARMKLPTVSTNVGGIPMLIEHEQTGLLFEPGDASALATALSLLAQDKELRLRLGQNVYDKARREFSLDATCRAQLGIYSKLISGKE